MSFMGSVVNMLYPAVSAAPLSLSLWLQALLILHYLVRNGSERVVSSAREHIYDMKPLEEYVFRDEQGKDQGINGQHPHNTLPTS